MIISIIGLGWLGLPLAQQLQQKGFEVKGSTTTSDKALQLQKEPLDIYQFQLSPHPVGSAFNSLFQADILYINIPPALRSQPATFHPEQVKFLKSLAQQHRIPHIIYISSISIYPDTDQTYNEESPLDRSSTGNKALFEAERILWENKTYDLTVLRLGGLMGGQRIPGRYFAGKEQIEAHAPVNYIHQEDVIRLSHWIITEKQWNQTFNAVSPLHPSRKDVYEANATKYGFAPPLSYSSKRSSRLISCEKLVDKGFVFKQPNPLDFTYSPI